MGRIQLIKQHDEMDCGAASFSMICNYYGLKITLAHAKKLVKTDKQGTNIEGITEGAEKVGFISDGLEGSMSELKEGIESSDIPYPFIARILTEERYEHYIVIFGKKKDSYIVGDPAYYKIKKMSEEEFSKCWLGDIITFEVTEDFHKANSRHNLLLSYFRPLKENKGAVLSVLLLSVITSLLSIGCSFLFETVISHITENTGDQVYFLGIPFKNIATFTITAALVYLLGTVISVIKTWILTSVSKKISISLSHNLYKHLTSLRPSFLNIMHSGEYMARFYDASEIRNVVSITFLSYIMDFIMSLCAFISMMFISYTLSFYVLILLAFYLITIFAFIPVLRKRKYSHMKAEGKTTASLKDSIDGINTLKSYGMEDISLGKIDSCYKKSEDERMKSDMAESLGRSIMTFLSFLSSVLILVIGMVYTESNAITMGALITFYYLSMYFFSPVSRLFELEPIIESANAAADRLNDIFELEPEDVMKGDAFPERMDSIEFRNVYFQYGSRKPVFEDLNITFKGNEKTAIIGESGCGKSTLARIIMKYYPVTEGEVLLNGKSLEEYSTKSVRKNIAWIEEDTELYMESVFDNIRMGDSSISDEDCYKAACLACADKFIRELPSGYATVLEEKARNLSGGQRQRLSIARALAHKPKLLIMDEATSNLDPETEEGILNTINSLDIPCIIIAHRMKTIECCDSIYYIKNHEIHHYSSYQEYVNDMK